MYVLCNDMLLIMKLKKKINYLKKFDWLWLFKKKSYLLIKNQPKPIEHPQCALKTDNSIITNFKENDIW